MAIEFSCPQCQHQLRTSEDKAGLSAKCPACGSPIWVPYAHEVGGPAPENVDSGVPAAGADTDPFAGNLSEPARSSGPVENFTARTEDETAAAAGEVPPRRAARAQVNCPNCAAENNIGTPICRYCGTSLEGVQPQAEREWRPPPFDINEIMTTAWRIYTQEIGLLVGCQLLLMVSGMAAVVILFVLLGLPVLIAVWAAGENGGLIAIPMGLIAIPLLFLLGASLQIGQTRLFLKAARAESPSVRDLYYGMGAGRGLVVRALIIQLCLAGLGLLGFILCCVPSILLGLCSWPVMPILLDRDCSAGDALGRTLELVKREFGKVLAVGAIASAVLTVASMVPYLGAILLLFAMPFAMLMTTVAYLRLTEQKTAFD